MSLHTTSKHRLLTDIVTCILHPWWVAWMRELSSGLTAPLRSILNPCT